GGRIRDVVQGGPGDDVIDGQAGSDDVQAGGGDDDIEARDGVAETIDCGEGTDTARTDETDMRAGCELPAPEPTPTPASPSPTPTPASAPEQPASSTPATAAPPPAATPRRRVINPRFDYSTVYTRTATRFTEFIVSKVP